MKDLSDKGFVELGEGNLPPDRIVNMLKVKGYEGWLTVELDASEKTPLESAKTSRKYLEKIVA